MHFRRIILGLLILNISLYYYLLFLNGNKDAFDISYPKKYWPIQIKELEEIDKEQFSLSTYFLFVGNDNSAYNYEFSDNFLLIQTPFNKYRYPITYKKEEVNKDPIIVQNIIYQEAPKLPEKPIVQNDYFEGYHNIEIKINSSIDDLVYLLSKDIKTNQQLTINYANVNLSVSGEYVASYLLSDRKIDIIVKVIE